ncbi:MAG TPA: universal stress protein [Streptosporangiaceae bacterium]|nr:universal stress protein [Streptosporangiaceae bacterium]
MKKTILLAVDTTSHVSAAAEMTRELCRDSGDNVIVLHVHEFAVGRWGRMQVDCNEGEGEGIVAGIVADLKDAGVSAEGEIREAQFGHIARGILAAADEHDARIVVLGSSGRADVPHLPFGSVSHRLLHLARRPVLIVPRQQAAQEAKPEPDSATAVA